MRSNLEASKMDAQKMEAQKNEARKSVLGFHGSDDFLGTLISRVLDNPESSLSGPTSSERSADSSPMGSQVSDASPLEWEDHLLFKSIQEQMKVLRESVSRLEYVTSEVRSLIPRS